MSEYQYYEFRAVDRPLDKKEMAALRALSTRAEITPTSLTNTYQWGDFKGNPVALMDRYFDAFVYVANWGTHRLMLRLPRPFVDVATIKEYCDGAVVTVTARKEHLVLDLRSEDEEGEGWVDGEEWMPSLISIRDELMRGDLRALYLGWLAWVQEGGWDGQDGDNDAAREPPVPHGLAKLSAPLRSLADFLRLDDTLISAAAAGSPGEATAAASFTEMASWVKTLPPADKDAFLLKFLAGDGGAATRAELTNRFQKAAALGRPKQPIPADRRTISQLLAARDALAEEKNRKVAKERARRERDQIAARARYLDELATREAQTWKEVEHLIDKKHPEEYDRAVSLLEDLRDLAERSGQIEEAASRIREIRQRHKSKTSLTRRLNEKNLGR